MIYSTAKSFVYLAMPIDLEVSLQACKDGIDSLFVDADEVNIENENDFGSTISEFRDLSLSASDWTVETLCRQIEKGNIEISPSFQRREVWGEEKKSSFIESLILGIPVPQIVIAQKQGVRGKYLVLDGKQRLLSILGFYQNQYKIVDAELILDIKGMTYETLNDGYRDALDNATIRTVRLSGWKSDSVLYTIFHRLNSGSVSLNTQELRSAIFVGPFTAFAASFTEYDYEFASLFNSKANGPDFRMRDVELLTRYCGIVHNPGLYRGNLKVFLDNVTDWLNKMNDTARYSAYAEDAVRTVSLYRDIYSLIKIENRAVCPFSLIQIGKRPRFNRAVFDALCYPLQDMNVRSAVAEKKGRVAEVLEMVLTSQDFIDNCSITTKTSRSIVSRVNTWSSSLNEILKIPIKTLELSEDGQNIVQSTIS